MTPKRKRTEVSVSSNLFISVASAISSAKVPQKPILKRLLDTLGLLSSTHQIDSESCDASTPYWSIKSSGEKNDELISLDDVYYLTEVLFTELNKNFEKIFSAFSNHNVEEEESIELATLFLRCCIKIMSLPSYKQDLPLEKAKNLLTILSRLIRDGPLYPRHTFVCSWLEVFLNEILGDKSLRDHLFPVDFAFSSCTLFNTHDKAGLVEMLSSHFLISNSDENMNQTCVERLYWKEDVNSAIKTPQISFYVVAPMLIKPLMFSAPKMIHAHLVLLVSEAIGVKGSDFKLIDGYINAFEKSVVLYTKHMLGKRENEPHVVKSRVAFEQLLLPSTLEKVSDVTMKIKGSLDLHQSNKAKRENKELVAYSVAYAKESLCVLDSSCSEDTLLSILGCVILGVSSDDVMDTVLQQYNTYSTEDLYFLAATLKLMSSSMLQTINALMKWKRSEEAVGDVRDCKEYKSVMYVVQRFEKLSLHLPCQSLLRDKMESYPHRTLKSKWMLMHFLGLLSVSFALKLDFLVKGSIFGMVVSLYLFNLEGGDLEALKDSISGSKDLAGSSKAEEANRKMCEAVALKFQKSRTLYLGKISKAEEQDSGVSVEEETCNGEKFLWCLAGKGNIKSRDVEDLADFIVCESGKDYSDWLKEKKKFRKQKWKNNKTAIQMWNKKQKAWRQNKRKIV